MASQEQLNAVLAALLAANVIATPPPQFLVAAIDANLDPAAIVAAVQEGGVPALIAATEAATGAAAEAAAQVLTDAQDRPVGPRTIAPTDAQDRPITGAPPPAQVAPPGGPAATRSSEDIAEDIASLEFEHGRFDPDTNTFADGTQIEITEGGDILPAFAPAVSRGFSPGAGNTILQPGETLVGPNGETLRALPADPTFGQTFQNERTGEVFRVQNGQLVPVPELGGFPGIDPATTAAEQVRQFGITQQGLNQRNALANAPGFLNAATAINQQQQSILNSGGDVVLRRFLAAGEQPPAGLQTFNQADQLRGFNLPGLLNQFGGLTQSLGFGAPGAGFGAPAPAAPVPAGGTGGTSGVGTQGTGFSPEVQAVIDKAAQDAAIANALAASQAEADAAAGANAAVVPTPPPPLAPPPQQRPIGLEEAAQLSFLAKGGTSDDMAIVGEAGPELAMALPGGGFRVIPLDAERLPKGIKKAQFGGVFGQRPIGDISEPTDKFTRQGVTGVRGNLRNQLTLQSPRSFTGAILQDEGSNLPPDVTQEELQGFARETAFPNVRRVFQQGRAPQADRFSFPLPTLRGFSRLSADELANAETALRLGAFGGTPTTKVDVGRAVRERFLPSQGRGRARLAGF